MTANTAPGEVLILNRDEVQQLLSPAACIERVEDTFRWVGEGAVDQTNPINLYVHDRSGPEPEYGHGVVQAFPALIRPLRRAAVKWLGSYRRNPKRGLPAISAIDLLTDIETGMPIAIIDGTSVTNMRTGAHSAVGAKHMARTDSEVIAVVGCGNEGRTHIQALDVIYEIREVRAVDLVPDSVEAFAAETEGLLGVPVKRCGSVEEAVRGADIVCVVTTATEHVLLERWVDPGAHVCAVTGFLDVDPNCATKFEKWVVGWYGRDLEWIEGGETGRLGGLHRGQLTSDDIYADLASEIIPGLLPGREFTTERTIMTHLGMPALDAAVADLVYSQALAAGVGSMVRIF